MEMMLTCPTVLQEDNKKKNQVYQNLGREPHPIKSTRQIRAQVDTTQNKNKIKRVFTIPITIQWILVLYVGNILLAVLSLVNFVI
jgi:hypothetical protein